MYKMTSKGVPPINRLIIIGLSFIKKTKSVRYRTLCLKLGKGKKVILFVFQFYFKVFLEQIRDEGDKPCDTFTFKILSK